MTEIVEWLRAVVILDEVGSINTLCKDAADLIEQQAASLAAKDKEIAELQLQLRLSLGSRSWWKDRAEQAARALAVFDAADDKDWDRLIGFLDQSAHGQFWREVLSRFRAFVAQHGSDSSTAMLSAATTGENDASK